MITIAVIGVLFVLIGAAAMPLSFALFGDEMPEWLEEHGFPLFVLLIIIGCGAVLTAMGMALVSA